MPFITTLLAGIGTAIAAGGTAYGIKSQNDQQGTQQQGLKDQNAIAQQEMADKQKTYDAANAFYTPYTKSGSPFLAQQQTAAADTNAQNTNSAAGTFRSEMGSTGLGFGPSGSTAAGLAQIGQGSAATGASNYLQNLLQNEQIKFQAQQGLISAGTMAGSSQNQPNVGVNLQPASTTGALGAAGQTIQGLIPKSTTQTPSSLGSRPLTNAANPGGSIYMPGLGTPTQGIPAGDG